MYYHGSSFKHIDRMCVLRPYATAEVTRVNTFYQEDIGPPSDQRSVKLWTNIFHIGPKSAHGRLEQSCYLAPIKLNFVRHVLGHRPVNASPSSASGRSMYLLYEESSWLTACRRCSKYIFILNLTPGFERLGNDIWQTRRKIFKFWDWVRFILKVLRNSDGSTPWTLM